MLAGLVSSQEIMETVEIKRNSKIKHYMKQNQHYESPAILRIVVLRMKGAIMSGSLDNANIRSVGQQVDDYDFSPENEGGFNHTWE